MSRNFSHNFAAFFRSLFSPTQSKSIPLGSRVDSAKMTNSRLKALETPDHLKEKHALAAANAEAPEPEGFQTYASEEEVAKRVRSLADMSQYRLAALARELPPDKQEESKD